LDYENDIVELLEEKKPAKLDVETIRKGIGSKSWAIVLYHCLQLMAEGKISGMKTSKAWAFWKE